ncbi:alpha/beta hydrolase family protein [Nocardia suismassiliense]|uniref:alpha/beta hydrolase family protein n=1 Tax=Nocardia suismassiliense TaxID=2077092 RepID=UPI000D1FA934|nr:prolyl oligopeptidase family serine peptidase [Nocardia suismassiliense]
MNGGYRLLAALLSIVTILALSSFGVPSAVAEPDCAGDVTMRPITVAVDGEQSHGWAYEPYHCAPGDLAPRGLILAVHGFNEKAADYPDVMSAIARRTGVALLTLDQRGGNSVWKTGEWNPWAGWHDVVATAEWYKKEHPSVGKTVLWGWSQGGMTSGLALAHGPAGLFDYWVNTAGPSNAVDYWNVGNTLGLPQVQQIERDAGGCAPTVCPQAYADRSTAALAAKMTAQRVFLVHGTADPIVPYQHSLDLKAALAATGQAYSMYTVVSGRGPDGAVLPGTHWIGPVWFQGACVVERVLTDLEPMDGVAREYVTDVWADVDTAPAPPPGATCAA